MPWLAELVCCALVTGALVDGAVPSSLPARSAAAPASVLAQVAKNSFKLVFIVRVSQRWSKKHFSKF
jgi:hypothetical protein